ncbi:type IV secretory system conjugative DNA transfer family protein [Nocardia sp. NPDC058518]|uniref:type IV secretory system conjugative DNA transfer family protein n=1 Tax=Nocardia sp. NPDC058518 TaxID=3346534 RepID=UPI00364AB1D4
MANPDKAPYPGDSSAGLWTLGGMLALYVSATVTMWISLTLAGADPANPIALPMALATGHQPWPTAATVVMVILVAVQVWIFVVACVRWLRRTAALGRFDFKAKWMATRRDVAALSLPQTLVKNAELGVPNWPGIPLGTLVTPKGTPDYDKIRTQQVPADMLYTNAEQLTIDIWGPRKGKTSTRVIPAIMAAPGAVVTTSNKRDVVDATRQIRADRGPVFVFDPQGIIGDKPQFAFNPIAAIRRGPRNKWDTRAEEIADIFLANATPAGSTPDAFFDPEGRDLLARLLLAAAIAEHPITKVYQWIIKPTPAPLAILRASEFTAAEQALSMFIGYSDRQKDGLFGTAKKMTNVLGRFITSEWVEPTDEAPEFDAEAFLLGNGTIYILSQEGVSSAGALATALTWYLLDTAEQLANANGGRMPIPLVAALDELANVVKWPGLPAKFSHYGSRGIIVLAILQNWSQGVNCFGEEPMRQMWSAAPIRFYGGGEADDKSLEMISKLIGDYFEITRSISNSRQAGLLFASGQGGAHISVNSDVRERTLFTVANLAQLPTGRSIMLWGGKAALVRPVPYWDRDYADDIAACIEANDPSAAFRKQSAAVAAERTVALTRRRRVEQQLSRIPRPRALDRARSKPPNRR